MHVDDLPRGRSARIPAAIRGGPGGVVGFARHIAAGQPHQRELHALLLYVRSRLAARRRRRVDVAARLCDVVRGGGADEVAAEAVLAQQPVLLEAVLDRAQRLRLEPEARVRQVRVEILRGFARERVTIGMGVGSYALHTARLVEQYVRRLDVAVDDARLGRRLRVQVHERLDGAALGQDELAHLGLRIVVVVVVVVVVLLFLSTGTF